MFARRKSKKNPYDEYPDDIFKDSRMSFGDHIEELRTRMIRAIKWLLLFLIIGFVLDGIGQTVGNPKIGIGKPMIEVITDPVESQVRDFYDRRADKVFKDKLTNFDPSAIDEQRLREIRAKLYNDKGERIGDLSDLSSEEIKLLFGQAEDMTVEIPVEAFSKAFGAAKEGAPKSIMTKIKVYPAEISSLTSRGSTLIGGKQYLSTLSVQEGFRRLLQGLAVVRSRARQPVHPLPVLDVHRGRDVPAREAATFTFCSARVSCCSSSALCSVSSSCFRAL